MKNRDLRNQTIKGLQWKTIGQFGRQISTLLITILLLRLLQPDDFGLLALVILIINLGNLLIEFGLSAVLIQKRELSQAEKDTVFWFCFSTGIVLTISLNISPEFLADWFNAPLLTKIIPVSSIMLLCQSLSIVPRALFEKELQFQVLAKIELSAIISSGFVAVLMAFNGLGLWSLVLQQVLIYLISLILLWYFSNYTPHFQFKFNLLKKFIYLGGSLFSNYTFAYVASNLDDYIIGKYFGAHALGLYNKAFTIISLPVKNISHILSKVMLPSFSKIKTNQTLLQHIYLKVVRIVILTTAPLMILSSTQAKYFIPAILGDQWIAMILFFQLFSWIGLLASINALLGPLIIAQGQGKIIFQDGVIQKTLIVLSIFIGLYWGIIGIIVGRLIAEVINLIVGFYHTKLSISISIVKQFRNIKSIVLISLTTYSFLYVLELLPLYGLSPLYHLIMNSILGMLFYWIQLTLFNVLAYKEFLEILKSKST